jgi:membrane-associated phospholipid phosphatase
LKIGSISLSACTAWARVEAKKHWLSDVLWGMALGNFIANFFYDSFLLDTENPYIITQTFIDSHGNILFGFRKEF